MRHSRPNVEINTGSMADIAFLLLIFFLVTATISTDKGINRRLSKACPPEINCNTPIKERNVLRIVINNNDDIMVDNTIIAIDNLKDIAKNFIDNNGDNTCNYCHGNNLKDASDNPRKAVISLQNGKQTSYKQFVAVQDELTKAYYELRKSYSLNIFKKPWEELTKAQLKTVKEAYPLILSEAEIKQF